MPKYSDTLVDHVANPRNAGILENADRIGRAGSAQRPPFMVVYLRLAGELVADAKFQTYGCGPSIAAGSAFTEMIVGRTVGECLKLTAQHVSNALGGVPADKRHCAMLPITAFHDAVRTLTSG